VPKFSKLSFIEKKFAANLSERAICYDKSLLVAGKKRANIKPGSPIPTATFNLKESTDKELYNNVGKKFIFLDGKGDAKKLVDNYPESVYYVPIPPTMSKIIKSYGMEQGGYAVLRPDQYISYLGDSKEEIEQLFKRIF
jgi:hypothetical protein